MMSCHINVGNMAQAITPHNFIMKLVVYLTFGISATTEIPKVIRANNRKISIPFINKPNNDGTLTKKQ